MNNKDYLHLLKGSKRQTMQDMIDIPDIKVKDIHALRSIQAEMNDLMGQYIDRPNTDDVRASLETSVGRLLEQYREQGHIYDARVNDVHVNEDGTANVNIAYRPRATAYRIDFDLNVNTTT